MRKFLKVLSFGLPLMAILLACGPVSEGQARGALPAGIQTTRITASGKTREVLYYVPSSVGARPGVVLLLHGGRASASDFIARNKSIISLADREGFVLMVPDAGGNWNDGRANFVGQPSDIPYIKAVIDFAATKLNGDRSRVFVTGPSNGGTMTYKIACDAPQLVAAIAPMIASFNSTEYANCRPSQSTPVIMFNGTGDPLMVYNGGQSTSRLAKRAPQGDSIVSTPETAAFWARVNKCSGTPRSENLPDRVRGDDTTITVISYSCPRDAVILYRINNGGHTIPGGDTNGPIAKRLVGNTSQEIDALARAVTFFKRYGL